MPGGTHGVELPKVGVGLARVDEDLPATAPKSSAGTFAAREAHLAKKTLLSQRASYYTVDHGSPAALPRLRGAVDQRLSGELR